MRSDHAYARGLKTSMHFRQANLLHSSYGLETHTLSHLTVIVPLAKAQYCTLPIKGLGSSTFPRSLFISSSLTHTVSIVKSRACSNSQKLLYLHISSLSWTISRHHTITRYTPNTMGVEKIVLKRGNGCDVPKKHDEVSMEYTGKQISCFTELRQHVLMNLQDGSTMRARQI
jgi:hypothetical protein